MSSLYFLYLNPITVFCAYFNGWEILLIDLATLVVLDLIIDKARSQLVGERLVQSVLSHEQRKMNENERRRKLINGKTINNFIKLQRLMHKKTN